MKQESKFSFYDAIFMNHVHRTKAFKGLGKGRSLEVSREDLMSENVFSPNAMQERRKVQQFGGVVGNCMMLCFSYFCFICLFFVGKFGGLRVEISWESRCNKYTDCDFSLNLK